MRLHLWRRKGVLGISQDVGNMDRSPFEGDSRSDTVSPRRDRVALEKIHQLRGDVVGDRVVEKLTVESVDAPPLRATKPHGILHQRFEDWLEVKRGAADDLQDFTGGGLLFYVLGEVAV